MPRPDTVPVRLDRRRWDGLAFEAGLISAVFGAPTTPDDLVRLALDHSPGRRDAAPRARRVAR